MVGCPTSPRLFLFVLYQSICALSINFIATQIVISFVREWYFYGRTLNYLLCSIHLVTLWRYLGMCILLIVIMKFVSVFQWYKLKLPFVRKNSGLSIRPGNYQCSGRYSCCKAPCHYWMLTRIIGKGALSNHFV